MSKASFWRIKACQAIERAIASTSENADFIQAIDAEQL